jgi:hypothetical protein
MSRWGLTLLALCLLPAPAAGPEEPRFTPDNQLIRPEGYREWVFVGASLGMTYKQDGEAPGHPTFHNVYLNPQAYQEYKKTGKFPERTILVMEVLTPATQVSINRQGQFGDRPLGVEAAVKDSSRFPETWAYFDFIQGGKKPFPGADTAKAFPKERCWACHVEHGQTDNVFTQFYPVLRRAARAAAPK